MAPTNRDRSRSQKLASIIAVGGGKGGVGKSIIVANLAIALAQRKRVVIVDADFGCSNIHTMFGIDRPAHTIQAFLDNEVATLDEVAIHTQVAGLSLIPGSTAVLGAANMQWTKKQKLLRHIRRLSADVVLVDVGAGVAYNTLDLFDAADLRLVVMTPQLTSLQNAYAFLKGAIYRTLRRLAKQHEKVELLAQVQQGASAETVGAVVGRLREADAQFAHQVELALRSYGARIIGNYVYERQDANAFHAMTRMIQDYLSVSAPLLGYLLASKAMHRAVNLRRPFLLTAQASENRRTLRQIAAELERTDVRALRSGRVQAGMMTHRLAIVRPPGAVGDYVRNHTRVAERQPVNWRASFICCGEIHRARVRDVTAYGALIQTTAVTQVGDRAQLQLTGADDEISLVVRHRDPERGVVGVSFSDAPTRVRAVLGQVDSRWSGGLVQVAAPSGR